MKLKQEVQYAIKALEILYKNRDGKALNDKEIAEIGNIPIKILYSILTKLKNDKLIIIERRS
ncbi:Rrf2 family transcriptional regulator [Clostridium perfringens]|uniref:Rrf2 family transcriptional regulator n=1 Tax=Clostridium perfringens TaxID=1502 RepID=UPI0039EA4BD7